MSRAANDVFRERTRQQAEEGFTTQHDDEHDPGELSGAGVAYAIHAACELHPISDGLDFDEDPPDIWLWEKGWWKPGDPRSNLVKAAALIIAEIEKIDWSNEQEATKTNKV